MSESWYERLRRLGRAGDYAGALALMRAPVLEAERAWRPIETAPRDGCFIVLWPVDPHDDVPEIWSADQYHKALAHDAAPGWTHLTEAARCVTHWMPLPPPPPENNASVLKAQLSEGTPAVESREP